MRWGKGHARADGSRRTAVGRAARSDYLTASSHKEDDMADRYLDDLTVGESWTGEAFTITEAEIIAFAQQFDPQPMHVDKAAAEAGRFGGLIASGWHVASVWMKLVIADGQRRAGNAETRKGGGVSPGFLNLRWIKPTRPGMTLHYDTTTHEKIELKSRPDLGLIRTLNLAINDHGETVMSFTGQGFWPRRPRADPCRRRPSCCARNTKATSSAPITHGRMAR